MRKTAVLCLILTLILTGCGGGAGDSADSSETGGKNEDTAPAFTLPVGETVDIVSGNTADYEDGAAIITLTGDGADCSSDAVKIDGTTVTVTDEGTYIIRGTLDDGMIVVNADKTDKTTLVLDGASVTSSDCAALYVAVADKVTVVASDGSVNSFANGGTFVAIDDANIDGAVFSREDIQFEGSGTVSVTSPAGHGIVSKDDLKVTGTTISVAAASHGLAGKDAVIIENAVLSAVTGKDGIHAENNDDTTLGSVTIDGGSYSITAEGDGISAATTLTVSGGYFDITAGGGSENGDKEVSDSFGGYMGGGPGGMMGIPGGETMSGSTATAEDDGTSIKGIKSSGNMTLSGGTFNINSADDAIHSNSSITLSGGTFVLATGDDGIHADETLTVTAGDITVTESYEGLEALDVAVNGGNITLTASDDGINAAGGTDQSGFGGIRGDSFGGGGRGPGGMGGGGMGGMSAGNGSIVISGGTVDITASGDGIDANGSLEISGGYTVVRGPTMGDTATLDYDTSATITGGTFIGTGASGMAQTFSGSEQGLISLSVGNRTAGTAVSVIDSDGNEVISFEPTLDFAVVIISTPELKAGETYTVNVGSDSGDIQAQ